MAVKKSCNPLYIILITVLVIVVVLIVYIYIKDRNLTKEHRSMMNNISNNVSNNVSNTNQHKQQYHPPIQEVVERTVQPVIVSQPQVLTQEQVSLERIYNPLKYPYRSPDFYKQSWYPNQTLPSNVVGCGARNIPCLGGSQIAIPNQMSPIDVSGRNIAPVNISTRGPIGQPQQVGAIYQVFGNENQVYPLYGRKKYPNGNNWEYYTTIGQYGVKMPIITKKRNEELGTNDIVFIQGQRKAGYRVTMYDQDSPEYIPYA